MSEQGTLARACAEIDRLRANTAELVEALEVTRDAIRKRSLTTAVFVLDSAIAKAKVQP